MAMAAAMRSTFFLPGAGASASFWKPVASHLRNSNSTFFAWPGLGNEPAQSDVRCIDDLVAMVLRRLDDDDKEPVNIVAQSMGGLIAIKVALAAPKTINKLVLTATSGGLPVSDLGGSNWRQEYLESYPSAASWIADEKHDLSESIPSIRAPTLLIWGDNDSISPVAVGQRLLALLPNASLKVVKGADHDVAQDHAEEVAQMIQEHLKEV